MFDEFDGARMGHAAGLRRKGDAASRVLTAAGFAAAAAEIAAWKGYAPTPLFELDALAGALGLAKVLYKDEGPRFGLGSFKALGGRMRRSWCCSGRFRRRSGGPRRRRKSAKAGMRSLPPASRW